MSEKQKQPAAYNVIYDISQGNVAINDCNEISVWWDLYDFITNLLLSLL